jgi:hypothetical protein
MIDNATLIAVLDDLALEVEIVNDAFGVAPGDAGTIYGMAVATRDALAAINDAAIQEQLTPVFARRATLVNAKVIYPALNGLILGRALDTHFGGTGSLNRYLTAQNLRVHPNVRLTGIQIDSVNVFRPTELDPVARYEGTGAGTGTFMAGSDIDANEYGPSALELVAEDIGASGRTLRLTVRQYDGTTVTRDVIVPGNSAVNATFPVGGANDRYVGVTNIVTVGGGGLLGDSFRVRTKVEREIAQ